jgi:hypothetical protein
MLIKILPIVDSEPIFLNLKPLCCWVAIDHMSVGFDSHMCFFESPGIPVKLQFKEI